MNKWHNFYKLLLGYFLIISSLLIVDRYLVTDSPNFPNLTEICIIDNEITTMSECYDIMINGL
ncbi:hypothetical protein [Geminocystis sp. NIES-3709]|uniref:hypothetical protein n=1 Tax=Geminocystis sp. NIES-3709 TaxID=1617448 RepID=UPI00118765E2|nr:hypothetical protein [Geminocystis sp. NIES-3709]